MTRMNATAVSGERRCSAIRCCDANEPAPLSSNKYNQSAFVAYGNDGDDDDDVAEGGDLTASPNETPSNSIHSSFRAIDDESDGSESMNKEGGDDECEEEDEDDEREC